MLPILNDSMTTNLCSNGTRLAKVASCKTSLEISVSCTQLLVLKLKKAPTQIEKCGSKRVTNVKCSIEKIFRVECRLLINQIFVQGKVIKCPSKIASSAFAFY